MGVLIITHYQRILHMVKPQFVHIMFEGRIVKEGGPELVTRAREARVRLDPRRGRRGDGMSLAVPTSAEFPVLAREGLVYLDTAATSQTVRPALEAMERYYETYRASIHRGVYPLAAEATEAYEGARDRVAAFTGSTPGETVFTRNATEAINLVAGAWGRANVGADDLVVVTQMEHHSNIVPWQLLGCRLAYVPVTDDGLLDLDAFDALLEQRPEARRRRPRLQRARHDQPDRRDRAPRARRRRGRDGRRRAGRPASARRRGRARRRLLRLDRPQGLRADRHRRAARPPRAAGDDAAVPRRRAHDRPRRRLRVDLGRAAGQVRGGHDAGGRGDRPRRRRRLAGRRRDGRRARARPRRHGLRAGAARRGRRADRSTAPPTSTCAARWRAS